MSQVIFPDVRLESGPANVEAWIESVTTDRGVHYVFIERKLGKRPH
jgi:hypothetical protein